MQMGSTHAPLLCTYELSIRWLHLFFFYQPIRDRRSAGPSLILGLVRVLVQGPVHRKRRLVPMRVER